MAQHGDSSDGIPPRSSEPAGRLALTAAQPRGANAGPPLALGAASRLVGVDPDTLRRWADDGRVEVLHTAGGHRRFTIGALERLMRPGSAGGPPLTRLGGTPARITAAYRRSYRPGRSSASGLPTRLPDDERAAWRTVGQDLVGALVRHLDLVQPTDRIGALRAAVQLAEGMGARLAMAQVTLSDAVALFVAARRPLLAELRTLSHHRATDARQLGDVFDAASAALDQCLLRFIVGHRTAT